MKILQKSLFILVFISVSNQPMRLWAQALSQTLVTINYLSAATITENDFRRALSLAQSRMGRALSGPERRQMLESMINDIIVTQAAERNNIRVTDIDVLNVLQEMGQIPQGISLAAMRENYNGSPMAQDQSWDEFMTLMRRQLAIQRYLQTQITPIQPTAMDVEKAYADNQQNFIMPVAARVSHIFFRSEANATPAQRAAVQSRAADILRQINAGTLTFEQAVRLHSDDQESAPRLGDLGLFLDEPHYREMVGNEFAEAIFRLRPGQISPVVLSSNGFHILRVTDRIESALLQLDEVSPNNPNITVRQMVEQQLRMLQVDQDTRALVEQMRSQATITINQNNWGGWERGERNP